MVSFSPVWPSLLSSLVVLFTYGGARKVLVNSDRLRMRKLHRSQVISTVIRHRLLEAHKGPHMQVLMAVPMERRQRLRRRRWHIKGPSRMRAHLVYHRHIPEKRPNPTLDIISLSNHPCTQV